MTVSIKDFGAIGDGVLHPLSERFTTLAQAQAVYPFVTALTQSIDWAATQAAMNLVNSTGGGDLLLNKGIYVMTDQVVHRAYVNASGEGTGQWLLTYHTLKKTSEGTEFRFVGTGAQTNRRIFVTSNYTSGGSIPNPVPLNSPRDSAYALTNYDTPFSCAWQFETSGRHSSLSKCRIVPNFSGIDGYNNTALTTLSDAWDVGVWVDSSNELRVTDVQSVGYWRKAGLLQTTSIDNVAATSGAALAGSECCTFTNCTFSGMTGLEIRGSDQYRIVASASPTLDIVDHAEILPAASGSIRIGADEFSATIFTYASFTRTGGVIRFTISGTFPTINAGDILIPVIYGNGISNTVYRDCNISGLDHASGYRTTSTQLGLTPSACIKASGSGLRGVVFDNTKRSSQDDVDLLLHHTMDFQFYNNSTAESKVSTDIALFGLRVIANPTAANNTFVTWPTSGTSGLICDKIANSPASSPLTIDTRPYNPTLATGSRFASSAGLFNPASVCWREFELAPTAASKFLRPGVGGNVGLSDSSALSKVQYRESTDRFTADTTLLDLNINGQVVAKANSTLKRLRHRDQQCIPICFDCGTLSTDTFATVAYGMSIYSGTIIVSLGYQNYGMYIIRVVSGSLSIIPMVQSANMATTTGPLTGTTGTVGKITVSVDSSPLGSIYIENRLTTGGAQSTQLTLLTGVHE